jgi:hypothetical protein
MEFRLERLFLRQRPGPFAAREISLEEG